MSTKPRQETPVNREDLPECYHFQASITTHPIIRDEEGVIRYKRNHLILHLTDLTYMNNLMNHLWMLYQRGLWSREDFMQFYRDIGYSLSGFEEVWGEELDEMEKRGNL